MPPISEGPISEGPISEEPPTRTAPRILKTLLGPRFTLPAIGTVARWSVASHARGAG